MGAKIPASAATRTQGLSFGVVAGGYADRGFDSRYVPIPGFNSDIPQSGPGGYVVGPLLDVRLFRRLSLGVEALYKPLHYRAAASFRDGVVIDFAPATVVAWQFPVLAKYKCSLGRVRPFLFGAVVGPDLSGESNASTGAMINPYTGTPIKVRTSWGPGRLVIGPLAGGGPANSGGPRDRVQVLVGVTF